MVGTWKNCERLALWKKEDKEYDGANSHSCMYESRSLEEIRPEEVAQLLQERAKRNKEKHDIYRATHKKEIRATQKIWDEENKEHRKELKRQWNEENKEHVNEYQRKRAKTAKETAQFPCNDCGLNFANKTELKRHQDSEIACKPKRDAARSAKLTCGGCQREFAQMANLERHIAQGTCRTVEQMSCPTCGRVIKSKSNLECFGTNIFSQEWMCWYLPALDISPMLPLAETPRISWPSFHKSFRGWKFLEGLQAAPEFLIVLPLSTTTVTAMIS